MRRVGWALLALVGSSAAAEPQSIDAFAVRTIMVSPDAMPAYLSCLGRERRGWQRLHANGRLRSVRVFRKTAERSSDPGPQWSVLVVARAADERTATRLAARRSSCDGVAGARLVRSEIMSATPGGDHPAPPGARPRPDLAFLVEFIHVDETPAALAEYRETMRTSIGPAVGRLVEDGAFYGVLFLETRRTVRVAAGAPGWNQIHIRGFYPDPGPTPPTMTRYMEEAAPERGGFRAVFTGLDAIRRKPRDDVAEELPELAI